MLAGVCAGLAEYLNVDVTFVRLAFVLISLAGGAGILGYIVAAIIMPDKYHSKGYRPTNEQTGTVFERPLEAKPQGPAESEWRNLHETPNQQPPRPEAHHGGGDQRLLALILIGVGGYMLVNRFYNLEYLLQHWWPLLLVLIGVAMLGGSFTRRA